jgi:membrane protein DedA with SNARE-associated domain
VQDLIQVLNDLPPAALLATFFFATLVSEDAACIAAGAAAANGRIGLAGAITACFLGIFAGDMLLYAAGRALGGRVLDNGIVRRMIGRTAISNAAAWLERNGSSAVFLSRFITGLRVPTYLAAGALRTDLKKFTAYFLLASAIWTPIVVVTSAWSQSALFDGRALFGVVAFFITVRLTARYSSARNRRLLIGRMKRVVKWEFWPVQIFYLPVIIYVLWLAARHCSLTVFTAANPAFDAGGFKGESKNIIYNTIGTSPENHEFLLKHTLVRHTTSLTQRLLQAWRFMDENRLVFPIVVKPDAGERGKGVSVVHSFDALADALAEIDQATLVQEFAKGVEASIFYYRRPAETHGHIFSVTEKSFPSVLGNGRSTIEDLILDDARAVCLAERYFEQLGERVAEIPAQGAEVKLIEIGTHSRGAIFRDGEWLRTAALENAIDRVSRRISGFYFGRFDIKAPTLGELQQGHFKIIELNGVTSESTNIYDPRYSLIDAYRILFRQWRLAFEISADNVKAGAPTTGVVELARLAIGLRPSVTEEPPGASDAAAEYV